MIYAQITDSTSITMLNSAGDLISVTGPGNYFADSAVIGTIAYQGTVIVNATGVLKVWPYAPDVMQHLPFTVALCCILALITSKFRI